MTENIKGLAKLQQLKGLFFNTPLLEIKFQLNGEDKTIYAKYEALSFSGSIKDRMAYYLFEQAYKNGKLKENQAIVEVTSGNTGISLSSLGRALGHEVYIVMPDWLSPERYQLMQLSGANIVKISNQKDGFRKSMQIAEDLAKRDNMYYPNQFENKINAFAHEQTTACEIEQQLGQVGKKMNRFVAAVGSGGTIMGVDHYYKKYHKNVICHPVEAKEAPILSTNDSSLSKRHRIQGLNGEFISKLMNLNELGEVISVSDQLSLVLAYQLNKLGLSVGISSGANFLASLYLLEEYPKDSVVTVFADSALKYLSTDLLKSDLNEVKLPFDLKFKNFSVINAFSEIKLKTLKYAIDAKSATISKI